MLHANHAVRFLSDSDGGQQHASLAEVFPHLCPHLDLLTSLAIIISTPKHHPIARSPISKSLL
jgi:hypothetical protein